MLNKETEFGGITIEDEKEIVIEKNKRKQNQPSNSNNKFPTGWVVGGGIILVGIVLLLLAIIKKFRK